MDHKEGWAPKNWCFQIVVLEKTPEISLASKESKPVNPRGNQPWVFIGMTDAEAKDPILWPHDAKTQLTGKDSDASKDWGQEEKEVIVDEMVGWHHWLNEYEFEQTLGDSKWQRSLACCNSWSRRVRHCLTTEQHEDKVTHSWAPSYQLSLLCPSPLIPGSQNYSHIWPLKIP